MTFKETVKKYADRWFIKAFSGMAQGLFCTLIAGTIFEQIGKWFGNTAFAEIVISIAKIAKSAMGFGIGVGIANALGAKKLTLFSCGVAGFVGAFAKGAVLGNLTFSLGAPGNPVGAYVVSLLCVEIVSLYEGKTKFDILIVPLGSLILCLGGIYLAYPFIWLIDELGILIAKATTVTPFFMGIIVSVVMGILLTMPTSSAAIWASVAQSIAEKYANGECGAELYDAMLIAGGAAVVGCSCHVIGFAVASFRENGVSGLISQGVGTSMLQIPNIMKKPIIMLPEVIASAILGPVSTCVFGLRCNAAGGGMGTSGLVGVFGTVDASTMLEPWLLGLGIALLMFVLPAIICFGLSELFRKLGWISFGDQKLD